MRTKRAPWILVVILSCICTVQSLHATVETGWPAGTPNTCRSETDGFMSFEQGIEATEIESVIPGLEFSTTLGLNWTFGDIRTGNYNVYPHGAGNYETNGSFFAWLGTTGDSGRITFTGGEATYVSVLVSTYSGVTLDAYDAEGNFLATSGWAGDNLNTRTTTRLTVEAEGIAYVEIHDSGNYWLMDDLCTDAPPVCAVVPGRNEGDHPDKIDLVFVPDEDYGSADDIDTWLPSFLGHVDEKIDNRLGGKEPITGNLDRFNFYYTKKQGTVSNSNCAQESSIPDGLVEDCPFADAIVVLHQTTFGDCSSIGKNPNVFSAEGPTARSFIHEAGHGVFGVADEYDGAPGCGTYYFQPDPNPNIWATEDACRTDATGEGWEPDDCQNFTACQDDWWKLGTTAYIMQDGTHFANGWGEPAARRISWVLNQYQAEAQSASSKSIWLKLNLGDLVMTLLNLGFVIESSPDYLPAVEDFVASVYSTEGVLLGDYAFGDPRRIYAEWDYDGPPFLDNVDFTMVLPYFYNGARVDVADATTGEILIQVDISQFVDPVGPTNQPPTADSGGDQEVECAGPDGATVTLDGSGSTDPDGDPITCEWMSDTCYIEDPFACVSDAICPLGSNEVSLVVNDGTEDSLPDTATVSTVDTTPPEVSVSLSPELLWPPNHKLVDIDAVVMAEDLCSETDVMLTSITSSEDDNGRGDGNTGADIQGADLGTADFGFQLRAERAGPGVGRIYSVTYTAMDISGNQASDSGSVLVPQDSE